MRILLLFLAASLPAQLPDVDPPIIGQPSAFSGIVGRVRVEAKVDPQEATVEGPLAFVVRILGETSAKHAPRRESLKIFGEEAERDFWIEPLPDRDTAKPGVWEFAYRLRPKSADVKETPTVKLVYYQPLAKRYQTTFADRIPLTIRPQPANPIPAKEPQIVHAPHAILELAPRPTTNEIRQPGPWFWLAVWATPPLLCLAALILLPYLRPDEEVRRRRAMHRAARNAIAELKQLAEGDAATSIQTFARYLALRFGWKFAELGPDDAELALKRRGVSVGGRGHCRELLAAWDRHRFDPKHEIGVAWPAKTQEAIRSLEEDPCMPRF